MASRIGCSAGRTTLIDPNLFGGQNSSSNISVPLEDLNISVQLETNKKARTILTTTKTINTSESSSDISLKFIEGSLINGEKVLTTKYTDLTTSFDGGNDGESLGITGIDIDFSSAMAPLVTINFIDIKGSSIFQNESNVKNGINKYSTFFQLPYPIYALTVKGFYGMPVKYCLHMTKWESKFNSQTGNFEITANFIGYTYAMLSDMLLGYLKAIPCTKLGKEKYKKLKEIDPSTLTLNELMVAIQNIDILTKKISSENNDASQLTTAELKKTQLNEIYKNIKFLGDTINLNKVELDEYRFILRNSSKVNNSPQDFNNQLNNLDKELEDNLKNYNETVSKSIEDYNGNGNNFSLDVNDFLISSKKTYKGLSSELIFKSGVPSNTTLLPTAIISQETINANKLSQILQTQNIADFLKLKEKLSNFLIKNYPNQLINFDVYDFNIQYDKLKTTNELIKSEYKRLQTELAKTLRAEIAKELGFDSTVRNIVKVFTTAVEVFLEVIYDVSSSALKSTERTNELKKYKKNFDIKEKQLIDDSTNSNGSLSPTYYPWPEYINDSDLEPSKEEYLGSYGVLDNPNNVDELVFIDDLLKAFLGCKDFDEQVKIKEDKETRNWFPINPLDTRIFGITEFPYSRIKGESTDEVINLIMIRAITYLGITNRGLIPSEIQAMGKVEGESILEFIVNNNVKQALTNQVINKDNVINVQSVINGLQRRIVRKLGDVYYYDYIFTTTDLGLSGKKQRPGSGVLNDLVSTTPEDDSKNKHLIPINRGFNNTKWSHENSDLIAYRDEGDLFLTNYTTTQYFDNTHSDLHGQNIIIKKPDDGGIYIKLITNDEYISSNISLPLISIIETKENIIDLSKLSTEYNKVQANGSGIGFNQFGGLYGTQEFKLLNYDTTDSGNAGKGPFRFNFYKNGGLTKVQGNDGYGFNKTNGLGYLRNGNYRLDTYRHYSEDYFEILYNIVGGNNTGVQEAIDIIDGTNALHPSYGQTIKLAIEESNNVVYPFINFQIEEGVDGTNNLAPVSLFGSQFYYSQTSKQAKAFLFLHTFPWNGLINNHKYGIFDENSIINTFANRASFASVPMLWAAFIGGLLWRADSSESIIDDFGNQISGGSGANDPIIFRDSNNFFIPTLSTNLLGNFNSITPTREQFLTAAPNTTNGTSDYSTAPMLFTNAFTLGRNYKQIDTVLLTLPQQAKDEFKRIFFEFVGNNLENKSEWDNISESFEIFDGNLNDWNSAFSITIGSSYYKEIDGLRRRVLPYKETRSRYKNFDNYIIFSPIFNDNEWENNFILEIKDSTPASNNLLNLFKKEIIICNTSYKIWAGNIGENIITSPNSTISKVTSNNIGRDGIYCSESDLTIYINSVLSVLQPPNSSISDENKIKKEAEQEIFGTSDENTIKFQLYRTCKNIYDKWVGGTESSSGGKNIMFQGPCGRNSLDKEVALKYTKNEETLIDSFRFVDRAFSDIGDLMLINPLPVNDFLRLNPNSSFYDSVSSLLAANNFDFIPLPSYVNYNNPEEVSKMFEPLQMSDVIKNGISGPSFVCVYIGQKSKNLDFNGSEYKNDGFDITCTEDGNMSVGVPNDMTSPNLPHENNIAVFAVNLGQQNQNIFKDVILNQSEFSETSESLQIIDDISKKGSENNKTLAGQNMYNVYSVRSYKAEVEMMGNAMIQPMMYFQLNNIPMFHGAYMITHVKHSLKPNYMSTHFTGVRIKKSITKLLDASEVFMSLLETIKGSSASDNFGGDGNSGNINLSGSFPPIISTILENGGLNGNIVSGNITKTTITNLPSGIKNNVTNTINNTLLTEAVEPLILMLGDWVKWMKENGFKGTDNGKTFAYINSLYRTYEDQIRIRREVGEKNSAKPGTSNHGYGTAIDLQFFKKDGTIIRTYDSDGKPNVKEGYNFNINQSLVWLLENSYSYGWIIPLKLRDNVGSEEFWHFEYHGKSAACLLKQNNKIKTLTVNVNKLYKPIVKNPKTKDGIEANYGDKCDFIDSQKLDGTDIVLTPTNKNIQVIPPSNDDIDFYSAILTGIGAQPTKENLKFMYAWAKAENNTAAWNPLSTTFKTGVYTNYNTNNGNPVKNYSNREEGILATIKTLKGPSNNPETRYSGILNGLRDNIGAEKLSKMVDELKLWGTGALINTVLSGKKLVTPPIATKTTKIVNNNV